jgi:hypothetical protein
LQHRGRRRWAQISARSLGSSAPGAVSWVERPWTQAALAGSLDDCLGDNGACVCTRQDASIARPTLRRRQRLRYGLQVQVGSKADRRRLPPTSQVRAAKCKNSCPPVGQNRHAGRHLHSKPRQEPQTTKTRRVAQQTGRSLVVIKLNTPRFRRRRPLPGRAVWDSPGRLAISITALPKNCSASWSLSTARTGG